MARGVLSRRLVVFLCQNREAGSGHYSVGMDQEGELLISSEEKDDWCT